MLSVPYVASLSLAHLAITMANRLNELLRSSYNPYNHSSPGVRSGGWEGSGGSRVSSRASRGNSRSICSEVSVLTVGDPLMDVVIQVDDAFLTEKGLTRGGCLPCDLQDAELLVDEAKKACGTDISLRPGGSAANVARMMARLGGSVAVKFVGSCGDDDMGEAYRKSMEAEGVCAEGVVATDSYDTGRCVCLVEELNGERTMRSFLGASSALDASAVASAAPGITMCHLEGYALWRDGLTAACAKAAIENAGRPCVLSLDLASHELVTRRFDELRQVLDGGHFDVIFCNEEEALALDACLSGSDAGVDDDDDGDDLDRDAAIMRALDYLSASCSTFANVSLGARGCLVASQRHGVQSTFIEGITVRHVVDTVGCGDAYAAGVLWALAQGAHPVCAARIGQACGAATASSVGATVMDDGGLQMLQWTVDAYLAQGGSLLQPSTTL